MPFYMYTGERIPQIIHCRLRLGMSDLKSYLFNRHLTENTSCDCGYHKEDASHFLLTCNKYSDLRKLTINILPPIALNCQTLLIGNTDFSLSFNNYIFLTVQEFINRSNRFDLGSDWPKTEAQTKITTLIPLHINKPIIIIYNHRLLYMNRWINIYVHICMSILMNILLRIYPLLKYGTM